MNQDERRRLRRLMEEGLWTRLGKKNARDERFPGNKGCMMPLPPRSHWQKESEKKTWQEMRSRELPENFSKNEAGKSYVYTWAFFVHTDPVRIAHHKAHCKGSWTN